MRLGGQVPDVPQVYPLANCVGLVVDLNRSEAWPEACRDHCHFLRRIWATSVLLKCAADSIAFVVHHLRKLVNENHAFTLSLARSSWASLTRKLFQQFSPSDHSNGSACDSLVPPNRWPNSAEMPQAVSINHAPNRGKIEQLKTHS